MQSLLILKIFFVAHHTCYIFSSSICHAQCGICLNNPSLHILKAGIGHHVQLICLYHLQLLQQRSYHHSQDYYTQNVEMHIMCICGIAKSIWTQSGHGDNMNL